MSNAPHPIARCRCGRSHDVAAWAALPALGRMDADEDGDGRLSLANCPCGSTLARRTGSCAACVAGFTDEAPEECFCPVYGPRLFSDDAPALVAAYVEETELPANGIESAEDFAAFCGSPDVDPEAWADAERLLLRALRDAAVQECDADGCDRGLTWEDHHRVDCPACLGTGRTADPMPRLIVGVGSPGTPRLLCCGCEREVAEGAFECPHCRAWFLRAGAAPWKREVVEESGVFERPAAGAAGRRTA